MSEKEIRMKLSKKQRLAIDTLALPDVEEILYGGAKGGGKSVFGCEWVLKRCLELIQECQIKPSQNPPVIGFMGRKQSVDFSSTTLETWKRFIPPEMYQLKASEKLIVIQGTVSIRYGGLDDSDTIRKFNSAEFAFYFIDQAEECDESDIAMLRGTLRLKINGIQPKYKGLLTANPAICWLKKAFITSPQPGTRFIQALPSDNPFIDSQAYVAQLKKAFGFNPTLLNAYLYGSWDDLDSAFTVIPAAAIERCVDSGYEDRTGERRITVCDIAEDGSDETVIYDFIGPHVREETVEIYSHRDLMDSCGRIQAHAKKNGSNLICIDKVGLGAGVYSRLQEIYSDTEDDIEAVKRVVIYGFDGRIAPPGPLNEMTFKNYKTYAWFKARDIIKERKCDIPNDPILKSQLAGMTWKFTSGEVIMLDTNQDVKERLGQSPDRATTLVMGLDALSRAAVIKQFDKYARPQYNRSRISSGKRISWATV